MKIFSREPTLWLAVIYAVLTVLGTVGLLHFDPQQALLANAAIAAVVGAINAYAVRPVSPVAFTYAIAAISQLAQAYGLNLPEETFIAVNGLLIPILALLTRGQVTPQTTAVTRESTVQEKAREVAAVPTKDESLT